MSLKTSFLIPQEGGKPVLNGAVLDLFNAHHVTIGNALTLRLQPPFTNSLLVTLPEDQALAARHASIFQDGWGFGVTSTFLSGLTSISEFVLPMISGDFRSTAAALDKADPRVNGHAEMLGEFRHMVKAIIATCCDLNPDSGSVLLRMKQMHDNLASLSLLIDDDYTRLTTAITEVKNADTIHKLEAQQRELQDQLNDVNGEIAKGASTSIGDDISFGFEFAAEFLEGVTTGAVAGAALSVVGEVDKIMEYNQQIQDLSDKQGEISQQISQLADTIAEDRTDAMTLSLTAAQISVFNDQIKLMVNQTGALLDQMLDWKRALDQLTEVGKTPSASFYVQQVDDGIAYWKQLKTKLLRYSNIITLSKTTINQP